MHHVFRNNFETKRSVISTQPEFFVLIYISKMMVYIQCSWLGKACELWMDPRFRRGDGSCPMWSIKRRWSRTCRPSVLRATVQCHCCEDLPPLVLPLWDLMIRYGDQADGVVKSRCGCGVQGFFVQESSVESPSCEIPVSLADHLPPFLNFHSSFFSLVNFFGRRFIIWFGGLLGYLDGCGRC